MRAMPISTADLHDAHPEAVTVCETQFRCFGRKQSFAGPCFTIKSFENHRPVRAVLETPGDGRVLVVDGGGSLRVGLLGDQMATLAIENGWQGAVINGAIRDSEALNALDFGVRALGTTSRRSWDDEAGLVDCPLTIGSALFRSGSWVYADADSVIVSAQELSL